MKTIMTVGDPCRTYGLDKPAYRDAYESLEGEFALVSSLNPGTRARVPDADRGRQPHRHD